ncbi:MAG: hypothetical protein DMG68_07525 [Acidobacteria bacterium]|jgi:hypothetical protein|nr:MAG: hypothetical protein DMG68_07525 [Acidobacteriota bacterium]
MKGIQVVVLLCSLVIVSFTQEKPLRAGQSDGNTFVGIVSDSICGPRHKMTDKSAEECARACQRAGARYVLLAGDKVYMLAGSVNDVAYLAGQKAKVTGALQGDTIQVNSITPTQ